MSHKETVLMHHLFSGFPFMLSLCWALPAPDSLNVLPHQRAALVALLSGLPKAVEERYTMCPEVFSGSLLSQNL